MHRRALISLIAIAGLAPLPVLAQQRVFKIGFWMPGSATPPAKPAGAGRPGHPVNEAA